jgi:hypothetical protein
VNEKDSRIQDFKDSSGEIPNLRLQTRLLSTRMHEMTTVAIDDFEAAAVAVRRSHPLLVRASRAGEILRAFGLNGHRNTLARWAKRGKIEAVVVPGEVYPRLKRESVIRAAQEMAEAGKIKRESTNHEATN